MSKQIRPLSAYKKANPELYKLVDEINLNTDKTSKKGLENTWYYSYSYLELSRDIMTKKQREKIIKGIQEEYKKELKDLPINNLLEGKK